VLPEAVVRIQPQVHLLTQVEVLHTATAVVVVLRIVAGVQEVRVVAVEVLAQAVQAVAVVVEDK